MALTEILFDNTESVRQFTKTVNDYAIGQKLELWQVLLVGQDGNTFFIKDILEVSEEDLNKINLAFRSKNGQFFSALHIKNLFQTNPKKLSSKFTFNRALADALTIKKKVFAEEVRCPLNQKEFIFPAIAPSGHSFEKDAILRSLKILETNPHTSEKLTVNELVENYALKSWLVAKNNFLIERLAQLNAKIAKQKRAQLERIPSGKRLRKSAKQIELEQQKCIKASKYITMLVEDKIKHFEDEIKDYEKIYHKLNLSKDASFTQAEYQKLAGKQKKLWKRFEFLKRIKLKINSWQKYLTYIFAVSLIFSGIGLLPNFIFVPFTNSVLFLLFFPFLLSEIQNFISNQFVALKAVASVVDEVKDGNTSLNINSKMRNFFILILQLLDKSIKFLNMVFNKLRIILAVAFGASIVGLQYFLYKLSNLLVYPVKAFIDYFKNQAEYQIDLFQAIRDHDMNRFTFLKDMLSKFKGSLNDKYTNELASMLNFSSPTSIGDTLQNRNSHQNRFPGVIRENEVEEAMYPSQQPWLDLSNQR